MPQVCDALRRPPSPRYAAGEKGITRHGASNLLGRRPIDRLKSESRPHRAMRLPSLRAIGCQRAPGTDGIWTGCRPQHVGAASEAPWCKSPFFCTNVHGAAVKTLSPAKRPRRGAPRLDGGEHTRTPCLDGAVRDCNIFGSIEVQNRSETRDRQHIGFSRLVPRRHLVNNPTYEEARTEYPTCRFRLSCGCRRGQVGVRTFQHCLAAGRDRSCTRCAPSILNGTSTGSSSVMRPVVSVAVRLRPATTSSEPAAATSHVNGRSGCAGGPKRLDSARAEATQTPHLPTRFPEPPPTYGRPDTPIAPHIDLPSKTDVTSSPIAIGCARASRHSRPKKPARCLNSPFPGSPRSTTIALPPAMLTLRDRGLGLRVVYDHPRRSAPE